MITNKQKQFNEIVERMKEHDPHISTENVGDGPGIPQSTTNWETFLTHKEYYIIYDIFHRRFRTGNVVKSNNTLWIVKDSPALKSYRNKSPCPIGLIGFNSSNVSAGVCLTWPSLEEGIMSLEYVAESCGDYIKKSVMNKLFPEARL